MSRLSNEFDATSRKLLANRAMSKAGLQIDGAGEATVKTANAVLYSIDGVIYQKAALAAQSIAPTHRYNKDPVSVNDPAYVQPADTTVYYVLSVDAAGDLAVSQGDYAGQVVTFSADPSRVYNGTGDLPLEPNGYTAFAVIKVVTGDGVTFTPGTTALDAAGVTVSYFDVSCLYLPL
jgi:hypothetical protein